VRLLAAGVAPLVPLPLILPPRRSIRNRLTALKKDSSEYIRPQDVQHLYKEVIKQGVPGWRAIATARPLMLSSRLQSPG
jgi:hypothetical protein